MILHFLIFLVDLLIWMSKHLRFTHHHHLIWLYHDLIRAYKEIFGGDKTPI